MQSLRLDELPLWFLRGVAIPFGLIWGSFLNVVIYRVPREMSVVNPPSHCPACGKPVKPYDNLPVISYLVLRGRARCCGAQMSPRYLAVEVLGGLLSLAVLEVVVRALPGDTSVLRASMIYLADFALCLGLVAAAFIDAEHMYLPDSIMYGGILVGVGTASFREMTYVESIAAAVIGFVVVWLPFIVLYKALRGRAGMGLGDAKLLALAGAWFGWFGALFVLFAGALQGTVGAAIIYALRGKIDEPESVKADRAELEKLAAEGDDEAKKILEEDPVGAAPEEGFGQARLPFGPFLIVACLELLFARDWIFSTFVRWMSPSD
jgi:leader peptidase (prepilin peptidase)/N-methyltransferase